MNTIRARELLIKALDLNSQLNQIIEEIYKEELDIECFLMANKEKLVLPDKVIHVLCSLEKYRGVDNLMRDYRMTLAGLPALEQELEKIIKKKT